MLVVTKRLREARRVQEEFREAVATRTREIEAEIAAAALEAAGCVAGRTIVEWPTIRGGQAQHDRGVVLAMTSHGWPRVRRIRRNGELFERDRLITGEWKIVGDYIPPMDRS